MFKARCGRFFIIEGDESVHRRTQILGRFVQMVIRGRLITRRLLKSKSGIALRFCAYIEQPVGTRYIIN